MSQTDEIKLVPEVCANCGRFLRKVEQDDDHQTMHDSKEYGICQNCLKNNPSILAVLKALKSVERSLYKFYDVLEREYGIMSLPSYQPKVEDLIDVLDKKPLSYQLRPFIFAVRIWKAEHKVRTKMQRSWNGEIEIREGGKTVWVASDAHKFAMLNFRRMFGDPESLQKEHVLNGAS